MTASGSGALSTRVEWVVVDDVLTAHIDGERIAAGHWDSAAEQVRAHLERLAATSPDRVIHAQFDHQGNHLGTVVVTADGTVHDAAPDAPAGQPVTGDCGHDVMDAPIANAWAADGDPAAGLIAALRRGAGPSPTALPDVRAATMDLPATSVPSPGRLPAAAYRSADPPRQPREATSRSRPQGRPGSTRRASRPTRARGTRRRLALPFTASRRNLLIAAVVGCLVLGALTAALTRDRPGLTIARAETIGVPPPAEWEARSRWRTPPLLPEAGRVLMIDGTHMAFVTKDRTVALVEVEHGDVRWSARYPDGKPGTDLRTTLIDGRRVVAAQVGERLAWWDLETGEAHDLALPAGASVSLHGSAPLVIADQGRTAGTVAAGKLTTMPVPDGATPLAARSDGTVTATGPAGWWHLAAGRAPAHPTPWEHPGTAGAPAIVAYLGESIVAVLPTTTPGTAYVAVYSDRPQDVRFAWGAPAWFDGDVADWYPSPSRRWGILGRSLLDLTSARAIDLGAWSTQLVSADRALGMLARQRVLVGPRIPAGVLADDEAFPEDLATTAAAVRTTTGGTEVVYLLPPKAPG